MIWTSKVRLDLSLKINISPYEYNSIHVELVPLDNKLCGGGGFPWWFVTISPQSQIIYNWLSKRTWYTTHKYHVSAPTAHIYQHYKGNKWYIPGPLGVLSNIILKINLSYIARVYYLCQLCYYFYCVEVVSALTRMGLFYAQHMCTTIVCGACVRPDSWTEHRNY